MMDEDFARSEIERYLAIPGQAISYKIGERTWVNDRDDARRRLGPEFSLKDFHAHALRLGPMGLGTLEARLAVWDGR
jgi:uncharacterized protein (DUF885 family)